MQCYLFNKIRLIFNIIKYSIIKPGEVWENCSHKNKVVGRNKMKDVIWVVGKFIENTDKGVVWELSGIFDKEENAIKACTERTYFVGPVERNIKFPDITEQWPGCYYPFIESAG